MEQRAKKKKLESRMGDPEAFKFDLTSLNTLNDSPNQEHTQVHNADFPFSQFSYHTSLTFRSPCVKRFE